MDKHPTILMFLKAPVLGKVKTRLAASLGDKSATLIYKQLVEYQLKQLPPHWPLEIHYCGDLSIMQSWLGSKHQYFEQAAGDLGQRLMAAFDSALHRNAYGALAIGGDCPYLDESLFQKTHQYLQKKDVVIGPAVDGGYYLIAASQPYPFLFKDIAWSTENVLKQSIQKLIQHKITFEQLPELEDVDDIRSWNRAKHVL